MLRPPQMPVSKKSFKLFCDKSLSLKSQSEIAKIIQLLRLENKVAKGKVSVVLQNSIPNR